MNTLSFMFCNIPVEFTSEGWLNATKLAKNFKRGLRHYFENLDTKSYIEALSKSEGLENVETFVKTQRGENGGTWLHPDLAIHFGRWLDRDFAIWCDRKIREILYRDYPQMDWLQSRHETVSSNKMMHMVIKLVLEEAGITVLPEHYMAEVLMINEAMTGNYCSLERESLSKKELDLLSTLEIKNSVLIAQKKPLEKRKAQIEQTVRQWRESQKSV
jgi:hypothetical protein